MKTYTDSVLAGSSVTAALTHAVDSKTGEALCKRVKRESLCGDPSVRDERPTCEKCAKRDPRFDPISVRLKALRLLNAAPDMLEALKLFQAALAEHKLRDVKKRFSLCVADAAASNAIAKAEGRKA